MTMYRLGDGQEQRPFGVSATPKSIIEQSAVWQALIKAAPKELIPGLKKDLTSILSVLPALEDRPKTLVGIEFLIALISSGLIFGKLFGKIPDMGLEGRGMGRRLDMYCIFVLSCTAERTP